jgi:hypothetical protein
VLSFNIGVSKGAGVSCSAIFSSDQIEVVNNNAYLKIKKISITIENSLR